MSSSPWAKPKKPWRGSNSTGPAIVSRGRRKNPKEGCRQGRRPTRAELPPPSSSTPPRSPYMHILPTAPRHKSARRHRLSHPRYTVKRAHEGGVLLHPPFRIVWKEETFVHGWGGQLPSDHTLSFPPREQKFTATVPSPTPLRSLGGAHTRYTTPTRSSRSWSP